MTSAKYPHDSEHDVKRTVLITGCSRGAGPVIADALTSRGWRVIPTARQPRDLDRLRADGFQPVDLDLRDSESIRRACSQCIEIAGGKIEGIVNNAGLTHDGALESCSRGEMRSVFEVNLFGLQEWTNLFVPLFRAQGGGRIINISSTAALRGLPGCGIYSASKAALGAATDAMRVELAGSGARVILVQPGPLDMGARRSRPLWLARSPQAVAAAVCHALESARPRRRYLISLHARMAALLAVCAPDRLIDRILLRRWRRV